MSSEEGFFIARKIISLAKTLRFLPPCYEGPAPLPQTSCQDHNYLRFSMSITGSPSRLVTLDPACLTAKRLAVCRVPRLKAAAMAVPSKGTPLAEHMGQTMTYGEAAQHEITIGLFAD